MILTRHETVLARNAGNGILGIIDGSAPKGTEIGYNVAREIDRGIVHMLSNRMENELKTVSMVTHDSDQRCFRRLRGIGGSL